MSPGRRLRFAAVVAWVAVVALVTLAPSADASDSPAFAFCFICGDTGGADAILNVLLFVPLGLALGVRRRPLAVLSLGILVSAGIEVAQLWIPGRLSTLADLLWNALGAGVGASMARSLRSWIQQPSPRVGTVLAAAVPSGLALLMLGLALQPARTDAPYEAELIPTGTSLETYEGTLRFATLNGEAIPQGAFRPGFDPDSVLAGDWEVETRFDKGRPPRSLAPILRMHADAGMLILGVDGEDLVWRQRRLARVVHLAYTDFYFHDALRPYPVGQPISAVVSRIDGDLCMQVESARTCSVGIAPARSWRLLITTGRLASWPMLVLDVAWMAVLFTPLGLLGTGVRRTLVSTALGIAMIEIAVWTTPFLVPGWPDWLGMVAGLLVASWARPFVAEFLEVGAGSQAS